MKYKKISENFVNYNGMNKYINGFEKVYFWIKDLKEFMKYKKCLQILSILIECFYEKL
jgi:hypothetical protein